MGANQSLGADVFARRLPRSLTFDGHPSNDNVKSGRAHRSHTFQHAEKRRSGGGRGDEEASVSLSDVDAEARDAVDSDEDELSAEELREYRWRLLEPPAAELETLHSYSVRPLSLFLVVCGGMPVPRHWCCTTLRAKGGACGRGVAEALRFAIMFLVGLVVFVRNLRVWVCPPHDLVESDRQEWLQAFVPGFALIAMMTVWFGMMRSGLWVHVLYAPYVLASALYDAHDRIGYTTPNAPLVLPPKKKNKSDDRSSESSAATLEMSQDLHAHRDDADSDDVVPRSVPAGRNANGSVPNEVDEEMRALSQRAMERMSMFNEAQNEYAHQLSRSVAGWSLFVAMLAATIFFLSRANAVRSLESADTPEDRLDARKSLFERTCDEDAYDAMGPVLYLAHLFIWYYGAYMLSVTMFTASMYSYSGVQRMLIMVLKNFRAKVARSSGGTATSKTQSSLHHVKLLASWFSVKKVHALRALADMEGSLRRLATFTMIAAATVLSIGPVGTLVGFMFYDDDLTVLNFVSAVVVTLCVSIFLTLLFKVGREKTALANEMETVYVALGNAGAHISAGQMSEDVQRVHSIMPHMLDRSHSQLHIEAQQSDVHRNTVSSAAGVEPPTTTGQSLEELRARAPPRLDSRARVLSSGGFSVPMSLEEELLLEMEEEAGIDNVDDSSVKPMNWKVLSVVAEEVEQMRRASVVSRGDSSSGDEEAPLRGNTGRQAEEMEEEEEARRQRHAHELQRKRSAMDRVISHHHVERSMNVTAAPLGTLLYQYKRVIIGMLLLLVLGTVIVSLSGALVFPACAAYDFDALTVIKNSGVEWAALDSLSYSDCSSSLENIALLLHGLRASFTAHLPVLVLFLMVRRRFFTSSSRLVNFSLGSAFAVTTLLTILALFDKLTTTNRVSYALFVVNAIVVGKLWGDHYDSMSMQDKIDIRGPDFAVRVTLMEMAQSRFSTTEETQLVLRSAELRKIAAGVVIPSMASMTLGTHQGQGHVQADALQQTELPSTFTSGKVFMLVFWVQMLGLALLAAIVRSLEVPSFLLMDDDNGRMFVALLIHPLLGPTLLSVFTWAGFKLSETGHVFSENGVVPWVIAHCTLSLYSRFFVFTMSNLGVQVLTAVLFGLSKIINRTTRHVRRYFIWGAVKDAAFGRKKSETYRTHPYYAHTEMYAMIIEIASVVFAGSASLAIVSAYDESVDTSSSTVVASMILQLFVTMFADTIAVKVQIEFGGRTFLPIWKHFQRMYWFIVGCSFSAVLIIASLDLFLLSRRVQS